MTTLEINDALDLEDAAQWLNRALDRKDRSGLADWAERYGLALIKFGRDGGQDGEELQSEIASLEEQVKEQDQKLEELERVCDDAYRAIDRIVTEITEEHPEIQIGDYADKLSAISGDLERAS